MIEYIIAFFVFAGIVSGILLLVNHKKNPPQNGDGDGGGGGGKGITIESTISALQKANAMMYGAHTCPHTIHQLEIFDGQLTAHNNHGIYIECSQDPNSPQNQVNTKCIQYFTGGQSGTFTVAYPTWHFPNQDSQHQRIQGPQDLATLYSLATSSKNSKNSGQHQAALIQADIRRGSTCNTVISNY